MIGVEGQGRGHLEEVGEDEVGGSRLDRAEEVLRLDQATRIR